MSVVSGATLNFLRLTDFKDCCESNALIPHCLHFLRFDLHDPSDWQQERQFPEQITVTDPKDLGGYICVCGLAVQRSDPNEVFILLSPAIGSVLIMSVKAQVEMSQPRVRMLLKPELHCYERPILCNQNGFWGTKKGSLAILSMTHMPKGPFPPLPPIPLK